VIQFASHPRGVLVVRLSSIIWLATTAVTMVFTTARGQDTGYLGPEQPLQIRPEVDVYYTLSDDFRLLGQLQTTFIPADSYSAANVGVHCDWLIVWIFRHLLSADLAKTHALTLRLGLQYVTTLNSGTLTPSQSIVVDEKFTPRYFLPRGVLISPVLGFVWYIYI
jgi:hypothetical protein